MNPGDLVRIIASDGDCIGYGVYVREEWYSHLRTTCPQIFYSEGGRWTFGHFDSPWWKLEVISESR